jgi:hypothetical protein
MVVAAGGQKPDNEDVPERFPGRQYVLLDGEEWKAKFRNFRSEAWRLETLPAYKVPQETDKIRAYPGR